MANWRTLPKTTRTVVLDDVDTGTSAVLRLPFFGRAGMLVEWGEGVSAGEVTFETADAEDYAGTWNASLVLTAPGASQATGVAAEIAGSVGRVRISDDIVGGTVKVIVYLRE